MVFKDAEMAQRGRILRDHGMSPRKRYWHDYAGFNFRMTNMQAAVGVAQMGRVEELLSRLCLVVAPGAQHSRYQQLHRVDSISVCQ